MTRVQRIDTSKVHVGIIGSRGGVVARGVEKRDVVKTDTVDSDFAACTRAAKGFLKARLWRC